MRLYPKRLQPLVDRGNRFLREWEWTWTSAVVFSVALAFLSIIVLAVIPSFWLYFADQTLRWKAFWLAKLKEALAAGWITLCSGLFFLIASSLEQRPQKLRETGGEPRPSGGYR